MELHSISKISSNISLLIFLIYFCSEKYWSSNSEEETSSVPSANKQTSDVKLFTREEVAKHCTQNDCWIIVNGNVVDVTQFRFKHPGGDDILFDFAGFIYFNIYLWKI